MTEKIGNYIAIAMAIAQVMLFVVVPATFAGCRDPAPAWLTPCVVLHLR